MSSLISESTKGVSPAQTNEKHLVVRGKVYQTSACVLVTTSLDLDSLIFLSGSYIKGESSISTCRHQQSATQFVK